MQKAEFSFQSRFNAQERFGASTNMSKLAFVASFLAAFITMDEQFFGGATTREAWYMITQASQAAEMQVRHWIRPVGRH
jgi:hypothetical protein